MKKSTFFPGTSALFLAIARIHITKANKSLHHIYGWTAGVMNSLPCRLANIFTATAIGSSRTYKTGIAHNITVYTDPDCINVLRSISDAE